MWALTVIFIGKNSVLRRIIAQYGCNFVAK